MNAIITQRYLDTMRQGFSRCIPPGLKKIVGATMYFIDELGLGPVGGGKWQR
jgi:hypothetical protein